MPEDKPHSGKSGVHTQKKRVRARHLVGEGGTATAHGRLREDPGASKSAV